MELNKIFLRQLAAGIFTRFRPARNWLLKTYFRNTGGTSDANYCLMVWARHINALHKQGWQAQGKQILELGPGDSLGVGVFSILDGASKYIAVDTLNYQVISNTLGVINAIERIIETEETVHDNPKVNPFFEDNQAEIDRIIIKLRSNRLESMATLGDLREDIMGLFVESYTFKHINYQKLNQFLNQKRKAIYDLVFSHSVLEYIDDPKSALKHAHGLLRENAWSSHEIDLGSMRTSSKWDGHWVYSDFVWKLMKGKRPIFINRLCSKDYREILQNSGWKVVLFHPIYCDPETPRRALNKRYKKLDSEILSTRSLYFLIQNS